MKVGHDVIRVNDEKWYDYFRILEICYIRRELIIYKYKYKREHYYFNSEDRTSYYTRILQPTTELTPKSEDTGIYLRSS